MAVSGQVVDRLAAKFRVVLPHLDERQWRLLMGAEARALGYGGIRAVAWVAEVGEATVLKGLAELESGTAPLGRVRRPGGGRKRIAEIDMGLRPALLKMVEPDVRGDPMSPLRWTITSTRKLAAELARAGHRVSADTVADLLRGACRPMPGRSKVASTRIVTPGSATSITRSKNTNQVATEDQRGHQEKELVGQFANAWREWRPTGPPARR